MQNASTTNSFYQGYNKLTTPYSFLTLTYDNRWSRFDYRSLFRSSLPEIILLLKRIATAWRIVGELTMTGQLHFHILMKIKEKQKIAMKIFLNRWKAQCGYIHLRGVPNRVNAMNYMKKENLMEKIFQQTADDHEGMTIPDHINPSNVRQVVLMLNSLNLRDKSIVKAKTRLDPKHPLNILKFFNVIV